MDPDNYRDCPVGFVTSEGAALVPAPEEKELLTIKRPRRPRGKLNQTIDERTDDKGKMNRPPQEERRDGKVKN